MCLRANVILFYIHCTVDILENVNPDLSDSEFIEREDAIDAPTPGIHGSDIGDGDAPTPALGAEDADDDKDEEDLGDGEIDEDLAAELDLALGDDGEDGDEEDEDDEDGSEDDEDDEDEDDEAVQAKRLLNDEIKDLEAAVAKKQAEIASSANPLIRVCYNLTRVIFLVQLVTPCLFSVALRTP